MSPNQPEKTIDEILSKLSIGKKSQGYIGIGATLIFVDGKDEVKAALSAMLREIRGEDTHIHDGAAGDEATWEAAQNSLRAEFDQRATNMGFNFKEDK